MALRPGLRERIDEWLARRPFVRGQRAEALPITLDRRRIYVLPTRHGLLVGALILTMLLGALNYNNNPGLLLAFLLAAVAQNGVFIAHLRLSGLRITALHVDPVHAGEMLRLRLRIETGLRSREGVRLCVGSGTGIALPPETQPPGGEAEIELALPALQRGLQNIDRLRISTTQPLGLARAWSWWQPQACVLIYPPLETDAPPLPEFDGDGVAVPRARRSGDDPHHLRDYRSGDAPRQIAWKVSARLDRLLVREYEAGSAQDLLLDWQALRHLPCEQRIARLARWVIDAERSGRRYRLRLPNGVHGPARGPEHRHACLRDLALLPRGTP